MRQELIFEFIEIATHSFLYHRGVYPEEVFVRRRKIGGITTKMSNHPRIEAYIDEKLTQLKKIISSIPDIEKPFRLDVVIKEKDKILESLVFLLDKKWMNVESDHDSYTLTKEFEGIFRSFLSKLETNLREIEPLDPEGDYFFTFHYHADENESATTEWKVVVTNEDKEEKNTFYLFEEDRRRNPTMKIIPVHKMSKPLFIELYIEKLCG